MRICFILLFLCLSSMVIFGQENLVPNPDFETYSCIPFYANQSHCLAAWYNPTDRTPDYMHRDGDVSGWQSADIPRNEWGYQKTHSGDAYIALHMFTEEEGEEYLQVQLLDTLEVGRAYKVSVFVSMAEISKSACNGHSFLFSNNEETPYNDLNQINPYLLYSNPIVIRDSENWIEIKGSIIADHPYTYLTLGNFIMNTDKFILEDFGDDRWSSTYYLDDVSVVPTDKKILIQQDFLDDCLPLRVTFTAQNIGEGSDWNWTINGNSLKGQSIEATFEKNGVYKIILSTKENGNTYSISKDITINTSQHPIADFDIEQEEVGTNLPLDFTNLTVNATSYFWDFGDGRTSEERHPIHEYKESGDYVIRLIATNDTGCQDESTQTWFIPCANKIIANTFTPNGDGSNDVFPFDRIATCGGPYQIRIFNRWGGLVYETDNPAEPWDGGKNPEGTYYYTVIYRNGEENGSILVIREK